MFRILLIIGSGILCIKSTQAQVSYYTDGPIVEMIKINPSNIPIDSFKNGVFRAGERMILKMSNPTRQKLFSAVIDIQPDNIINPIIPFPKIGLYTSDCVIGPGEILLYKNFPITFTPPYGVDKLVTIFSPDPAIIEWVVSKLQDNGISTRGVPISKESIQQELKWILEGQPSQVFKDCFFSLSNVAIIPPKNNETGFSNKNIYMNASYTYNVFAPPGCEEIKDPENLYKTYPLLSFIQPFHASGSRGVEAEHEAETKSFVLKGMTTAMNGVSQILVNGENGILRKLTEQQLFWEKEVVLKNGKNEFNVVAITPDGKKNCEMITLTYDESKHEVKEAGKNYLLVIGINNYRAWPKLKAAATDALEISQLLTSKFQFSKDGTTQLLNEKATKENIDSVFRELITKILPADNLVVYYAGHGVMDNKLKEGYWIPVEGRELKLKKYIDYVSNSEIKKYLEALKAKHVLIIADACFSAQFFKTTRGEKLEENLDHSASKWLFCSGKEEVADKLGDKPNSPFAHHLINTLSGVSQITTSALFQKVREAVTGDSDQVPEAGPVANTGDEGGEFIFRKK